MRDVILYLKSYIQLAAACAIMRAFKWCYSRPWTGIPDAVKFQVNQNAAAKLRYWLLQNRIMHCNRCLNTRDTLKKAVVKEQQVYLCVKCYDLGVQCGEVKTGVEIIRPGVV